jgi:GntR family transcriptional repressor for pyruvate dehydrogenase complex
MKLSDNFESRRLGAHPNSLMKPRRADEIHAELGADILRGFWPPGGRLPGEHELAERYAVGRGVVREALARLRADGLVESRRGSGAYVSSEPAATDFRLAPDTASVALQAVFELRWLIEAGMAEFAARRRNAVQLARMAAALSAMDEAVANGTDGSDADDRFHRTIAEAAGNPHLVRLAAIVSAATSASRRPTWTGERAATLARDAQSEHRRVFAAIESGDAELAGRAAREHIEAAAKRLGLGLSINDGGTKA